MQSGMVVAACLRTALLAVLTTAVLAGEGEGNSGDGQASPMSVAVGATILGAMCFMMALFCLTNHKDPDMRKYTYEAVSTTISIFAAVLVFQTVNQVVEANLLDGKSMEYQLLVDTLHMLSWYVLLQAWLAWTSGAIGEAPKSLDEVEINMKCYGVILAHLTGFASINAWVTMQHLEFFAATPMRSLLVIPIGALSQFLLQRVTDNVRWRVSMMDDGEEDEFEALWNETSEEAENDVMGLSISFCAAQALRFLISGVLPDNEGKESWSDATSHTFSQVGMIWAVAVFFVLLIIAAVMAMPENPGHLMKRTINTVVICACASFAWCAFFGSRWCVASVPLFQTQMMLINAILALSLSVVCFFVVRLLDLLVDMDCTGDDIDHALIMVIGAVGILIGFSWEQCFDEAILSVASVAPDDTELLIRVFLTVFCIMVIVPAWKWWILPMVQKEGWRYGFVVMHEEKKWDEIIEHLYMKRVTQSRQTKKRQSSAWQASARPSTASKLTEISQRAKQKGHYASESDRMLAHLMDHLLQENKEGRFSLTDLEQVSSSPRPGTQAAECPVEGAQGPSPSEEQLMEVTKWKSKVSALESALQEERRVRKQIEQDQSVLEKMYGVHLDTVLTSMYRMQQHIPESPSEAWMSLLSGPREDAHNVVNLDIESFAGS